MKADDWEQELAVVQGDLSRIAAYLGRSARITGRSERSKARFLQSRVRLERRFVEMEKVLGGDYLLDVQEKALLHWCQVYLDKIKIFYHIRQEAMTRGLWIKLLKARMLGSHLSDGQISGEPSSEDLVTLAVRHAQLQNTEQQLKVQIASLEAWKASLRERYHRLGVIQANRIASRTLSSRYESDSSSERMTHILSALGKSLVKARWSTSPEAPEKAFWVRIRGFVKASEESLGRCESLAFARLSPEDDPGFSEGADNLAREIGNLARLDAEVEAEYQSLIRRQISPLRPIIVQKKRKKAKTTSPETSIGKT